MQQTFAEASFEPYRKSTRREQFLDEMNRIVPCGQTLWLRSSPSTPRPRGRGARLLASNASCACMSATVV